jgi:hypothetical protein
VSQIRREASLGSSCSKWWAVLGSNQWPLPCETGVRGLRINDMRAQIPIATGTWYHVMSLDITQRHDLTVPKLSQRPLSRRAARDPKLPPTSGCFWQPRSVHPRSAPPSVGVRINIRPISFRSLARRARSHYLECMQPPSDHRLACRLS